MDFKIPLSGKRVSMRRHGFRTNLAAQRLSAKFLIKFPESLLLNYTPSPFSHTSLSPFSFVTFSAPQRNLLPHAQTQALFQYLWHHRRIPIWSSPSYPPRNDFECRNHSRLPTSWRQFPRVGGGWVVCGWGSCGICGWVSFRGWFSFRRWSARRAPAERHRPSWRPPPVPSPLW